MPQRILALEMPGDTVRAAVAERTWNSFHLIGVFEEERRSDEPDLSAALGRLLPRIGKPDMVVSAIPSELVLKRLLELPFSDARKLNQVVPFALEEHLPFPVDDAVVAFARVGRDGENTLVMAAMARRTDLKRHLDVLSRAGLDPKTVTLSELATANLLARSRTATASPHLVMDVESSSTSMVLLDSDGTPRAARTVNAGLSEDKTGPSWDAQSAMILSAARQMLLAHSSGLERLDVVLTGSAASMAPLRDNLSQALSLAIREAAEFDYSFLLNGQRPDMTRFAGCVAMLLGEMPTRPTEMLNFRQGEFAFKGRVRGDLSAFRTTALFGAAAVLLALLHLSLGIATQLSQLHALDRAIGKIAAPALGPNPPADSVAALRAGIIKMNKRLALIGGNTSINSPIDALLAVSRDIPKRFPVEMLDVAVDTSGLKLSGEADSFGTVDQMKKALGNDAYFGAIEVTHAKAATDGKVEFQLDARFKDAITDQ